MSNITEQLKELQSVKPKKDWVEQNKEQLISQITAQTPQKQSTVFGYWYLVKMLVPMRFLNFVAKPVGIVTIALFAVITSGIYSVNASRGSLPGDMLYSVKLTSEKVQVTLAISEEKQTQKHLDFANERANEIEKIIQQEKDPVKKQEQIFIAADNLKKEMDHAQVKMEEIKVKVQEKEKTQKVLEVIKRIDQQSEELSDKLNEQKDQVTENKESVKKINEAVNAANKTGIKAVEVIVDKYEKGEADISSEEVFLTVEKKLQQAQDKIEQVKEQEAQTEELKKEQQEETVVNEEEPSAPEEDSPQDEDVSPAEQTTEPEVANSQTAQENAELAKELLDQGDLSSAVQKVIEIEIITSQIEETADEADGLMELQVVREQDQQEEVQESETVDNSTEEEIEISR